MGGRRVGRVAALALAALIAAAQQAPVFRVDVRLVRLLATVKDDHGRLVGSLVREDFTVFDNGVRQEIAVFERRTEQPLSVSILIDTSGSTAKELRYEIESVQRFLRALFNEGNPQDAAALYSFNYEVTKRTPYTRQFAVFERALRSLKAEAGTSLYDAIYLASQEVRDRAGRHVIVVVTDGGDTTSVKTYHAALEEAQRADAVLYAILVMPITNDAGRNIGGENALIAMTSATGGRVFTPNLGAEMDAAFTEILTDLRTQYLIGYYPKNVPPSRNRFHRVEVKLSRPGLRVLTRSGYYGDAERVTLEEEGPKRAPTP